jgi:PAS domain S-box-containing protein
MNAETLYLGALQQLPGITFQIYASDLACVVFQGNIPFACQIGQTLDAVLPDKLQSAYRAALTGTSRTVFHLHNDQFFRVQTRPVTADDGMIVGGIALWSPVPGDRALFEQTRDAVIVQNLDGEPVGWNPAAAALLRHSDEGQLTTAYAWLARDLERLTALRAGDTIAPFTHHYALPDNTAITVEVHLTLVRDEQQQPAYILSIQRDVTAQHQAEQALQANEALLLSILNTSRAGIMAFQAVRDAAGQIIDFEWLLANDASGKLVKRLPADLLHKRLLEELPGTKPAGLFDQLVQVVETGQTLDIEHHYDADMIQGWFHSVADKLHDGFTMTSVDITAQKQAEQALRTSEERYRTISELISDYAYSHKVLPDGPAVLEWVTESHKRITGYSQEEALRIQPQLVHPDDHQRVEAEIQQARTGVWIPPSEHRIVTRSGDIRWLRVARHPVRDPQSGRVVRIYSVAQDITARKQAELDREISEERYRIISELISDYAFSASVTPAGELEMEWWTGAFTRITGYSAEAILDKNIKIVHPDDSARVQAEIQQALAGEHIASSTYRIITREGETRWLQVARHPVWDAEVNRVVRIYTIAQDITARKAAENALVHSEERFRLIAQATNDALYDRDRITNAIWYSDGYIRRFIPEGIEPEDYDWAACIHPDDQQTVLATQNAALEQGRNWQHEYRFRCVDGSYAYIQDRRYLVRDSQGRIIRIVGAITDITESRTAEEALRTSEERFRFIANAVSDSIYDWDMVNNTVWRNAGRSTVFFSGEDFTERHAWYTRVHPDDIERVLAQQTRAINAGEDHWVMEYRLKDRDDTYRVVEDRAHIIRNTQDQPIRLVGAITDITARKEAEKRDQELIVQKEKIAVLTDLVAAMSHDFRTPLAVINTSIYLLNRAKTPEDQQRHMQKLQNQVEQIEKLVDGLRTVAVLDNPQVFSFRDVDINLLADFIETQLGPRCQEQGLRFVIEKGTDLARTWGDENWLHEALLRLVHNAIQYNRPGGTITLRTAQEADKLVITVQDTGIGMSEEQQQHVFNPLYRAETHRPTNRGYGLGLPIAHKIITAHQGSIDIHSVADAGTTIRVRLPAKP